MTFLIFIVALIFSCAQKQETVKEEENWHYLYDLGMSSYYAKNFSEAIAYLYRATKIAPHVPKIWNALGLTYMEVEEYDKAERAFRRALEIDPDFSEAKMNLGVLYFRMKDYKNAIRYLEETIKDEAFPKKHIAFYNLAKVYKEIGDKKKYMEYLKKATAYNPMFIAAQLELGNAYMDEKMYKEAEKLYKNLLSNNFKSPEIYLNLARIYYETGRYEKAKDMIRLVLEDKQTTNLQRTQAYDLLTKILIKEQQKELERLFIIKKKEEKKTEREKITLDAKEKKSNDGKFYGIQVAAFSSMERAEKLIRSLREKGLNDFRIVNISGIYKVIYGKFSSREEAKKELEKLKDMEIIGFIVEIE